jgi:tetratricopeptide (TPR) repeat protein
LGDYRQAIENYEQSLTLTREVRKTVTDAIRLGNLSEYEAVCLRQLSILYARTRDYTKALANSQQAELLFRDLGNETHVGAVLGSQGLIYYELALASQAARQVDAAAAYRREADQRLKQSLAIARSVGDDAGAASSLNNLGAILMDTGQIQEAIAAFTESLEICQRLGFRVKVGISLERLGTVHERQGQYPAALEKYEEALALLRQYGSPQQIAIEEGHIARVRGKMGGG